MNPDQIAHLSPEEKRQLLAQLLKQKASQTQSNYPLAYGQQALWFLHQSHPTSPAYNIAMCWRIRSAVNVPAVQKVFQALVVRHPALRTRFPQQGEEVVQEVRGYEELAFEQIDARVWGDQALREQLIETYHRPFDLENGPLLRLHLFTRWPQDHILLLVMHHIVGDAWSMWQLADEFRQGYEAECDGRPLAWTPLTKQYSDFVQWQKGWVDSPAGEKAWHYWQKQLAGELPLLQLPTDRPYSANLTPEGQSYFFKLDQFLLHGLRSLSQTESATLFMTLLAGFQILLHRYTGQEDILVGSPTTGRGQPEFAQVVGYFVNPIVLRGNLSGRPSFRTFLQQVRQTVLQGLEHQDFPFTLLVERLHPPRHPGRSPLFQAMFVYQKPQATESTQTLLGGGGQIGDLRVEPYDLPQMEGQFDLHLEITEQTNQLAGVLKYNPQLFDEETIIRLVGHYQTLLSGALADANRPLDQLPLLAPAERQKMLHNWNDTGRVYPTLCLHELFEQQASRTPEAIAIQYEQKTLTYDQLNRRANQLAAHLREDGLRPGQLVGVCLERSLEMVIALYGVLKAGGAYVPLDPTYPAERLAFMLNDAQPAVLLTQSHLVEQLGGFTGQILPLDTQFPAHQTSYNLPLTTSPDKPAYMIYTSGSTGQPKGAVNSHKGIVNRLLWMQEAYNLTPADHVLQKTPFSFDVSVWEFFWPLFAGSKLVIAKPEGHKDSAYLVQTIQEQAITTLHFVPSMLSLFVEEVGVEQCTSLRRVICSGEALPYELQERFFEQLPYTELHNLYGPTEAAVDVTAWACRPNQEKRVVPLGKPIANTQLYILDPYLEPVPIGVAGELHIGGVQVGLGYHNRPGLTAEKFIPNPFSTDSKAKLYKTGDLARYWADGTIEYLGRLDFQVKLRGFRVELGEIEAVLAQHPAVRELVVTALGQGETQQLVAYLVMHPGQMVDPAALRLFLQPHLPEYMIPAHFITLAEMPLSPNGKVDRRALPQPTGQLPPAVVVVAPATELEQQIAQVWQEVLQLPEVGVHHNFFDVGGHSLLLGRVRSKLSQLLNRPLTMVELFQHPTIYSLARHLSGEGPTSGRDRSEQRLARQDLMAQRRESRRTSRK